MLEDVLERAEQLALAALLLRAQGQVYRAFLLLHGIHVLRCLRAHAPTQRRGPERRARKLLRTAPWKPAAKKLLYFSALVARCFCGYHFQLRAANMRE